MADMNEWPSKGCESCIRILDEVSALKEKVVSSELQLMRMISGVKLECELIVEQPTDTLETDPDTTPMDTVEIIPLSEVKKRVKEVPEVKPKPQKPKKPSPGPSKPPKDTEYDDDDDDHLMDYPSDDSVDDLPMIRRRKKGGGRKPSKDGPKQKVSAKVRKELLRGHLNEKMLAMNLLVCGECSEEFSSFLDLREHQEGVHQYRTGFIRCCDKKYDRRAVYQHIEYHLDEEAFKCDTCGKLCMSQRELDKHKELSHAAPEELAYHCATCGKGFVRRHQLTKHMSAHIPMEARGFECVHCNKPCASRGGLEGHIRAVHTKEMTHFCEVCGKGFASNGHLQVHLKSHEAKATEPCDICGKHFFHMQKHKMRAHLDLEKVACKICGKEYKKHLLTRHMKAFHSGMAGFKCTLCEKEFRLQKNYLEHMNVHLGVKKSCYFCPYQVTNSGNLVKHLNQVHPVEYAEYKARKFTAQRTKNMKGVEDGEEGKV